ncbi:MAG: CRISPR-associated endonuclease Cas2 [Candidatus Berkelbacteria bacterium]|nr:CRISPR-associated endonuclease Cas2 [Candidatus Berkelbacteria bacterium]
MKKDYSNIKYNTEKILYFLLITGGFAIASIIAPKLPYELLKAYLKDQDNRKSKFNRGNFNRDLKRLVYRGDVSVKGGVVKITKQGKQRILKYTVGKIEIEPQKVWDRKWRLVVFDIPSLQRKISNAFRKQLFELGFAHYQKSVFIHPYPCRDQIDFMREIFEIGDKVKLITAIAIDDEEYFLKRFDISI